MLNLNVLSEFTIAIPRHPCRFCRAYVVSSTVMLVRLGTYDSVNSFNSVMCTFASKCFPIELVPCSGGW